MAAMPKLYPTCGHMHAPTCAQFVCTFTNHCAMGGMHLDVTVKPAATGAPPPGAVKRKPPPKRGSTGKKKSPPAKKKKPPPPKKA